MRSLKASRRAVDGVEPSTAVFVGEGVIGVGLDAEDTGVCAGVGKGMEPAVDALGLVGVWKRSPRFTGDGVPSPKTVRGDVRGGRSAKGTGGS